MKMYICVHEDVPDHMVPVLVAHTVVNAADSFSNYADYKYWKQHSFKKAVVKVNDKEFRNIYMLNMPVYTGHESTVMYGQPSCMIPLPCADEHRPNVLKFAKLWKPRE